MNSQQAGNTAAIFVGTAHQGAGALGRDHGHVDGLRRRDLPVVNVESVRKKNHGAVFQVRDHFVDVERGLRHVRGEHHDYVRAFRGLGRADQRPAVLLGLLPGRTATAQADDGINFAVAQIERVRAALTAIAENRYALAFQCAGIRVASPEHFRHLVSPL